MHEDMDYNSFITMFPIICAYIEHIVGCWSNPELTERLEMYTVLINKIL